jgi:DNA polymerase III delta subunit
MLYLFIGNDQSGLRTKVRQQIEVMKKKAPEVSLTRVSLEGVRASLERGESLDLSTIFLQQGLFYEKRIIVLDHFFSDRKELIELLGIEEEGILKLIEEGSQIADPVILIESEMSGVGNKKTRERLIASSAKVVEMSQVQKQKKVFDVFALSDFLYRRDVVNLWSGYREMMESGGDAEAIHATIVWAIRQMALVHSGESALSLGMKEFTYSKTRQSLRSYTKEEVRDLLIKATFLPYRAREVSMEIELALEELILGIGQKA